MWGGTVDRCAKRRKIKFLHLSQRGKRVFGHHEESPSSAGWERGFGYPMSERGKKRKDAFQLMLEKSAGEKGLITLLKGGKKERGGGPSQQHRDRKKCKFNQVGEKVVNNVKGGKRSSWEKRRTSSTTHI